MQSLTIQDCFDIFNNFFSITHFAKQQENKMSEEKCEKVNMKCTETTADKKNNTNTLPDDQLKTEKLLTKGVKIKNNIVKKRLEFSKTKSKDEKKLVMEKKLKKIDLEGKKVTKTKKNSEKKIPIKRTKNRPSDASSSLSSTDNQKKKIRQMEIDTLNNLMTNINQEQQNENIKSSPTFGSCNLPELKTSDQICNVKNVKKTRKCKKKLKMNDSEAREIDKIIENLSSYKIPVESNCRHIFTSSDAQLRSGDEMESIIFVCVLCGESKDYYR